MKKRIIICSVIFIMILFGSVAYIDLKAQNLNRTMKVYDIAANTLSSYFNWPEGAQGTDLSAKGDDFSKLTMNQFAFLPFDSKTIWPVGSRMPKGFTPEDILVKGTDPGLGISDLHKQSINGEGITVAVIDKPILADHHEFSGRMTYIEVLKDNPESKKMHFHGMACASILAGEKCGVANKSKLYYFAVPDNGKNITNYTQALLKLLEVNSELTQKEKIQVVSISDGEWVGKNDKASKELVKTIEAVEKQGIAVVTCAEFPVKFSVAGCPLEKDKDKIDNYEPGIYMQKNSPVSTNPLRNIRFLNTVDRWVYVPADYRTTSSNSGIDEYAYWGQGGLSWACPYIAGLIALGKQVNPICGNDKIYQTLNETSTKSRSGLRMINPLKFIEEIKKDYKAPVTNQIELEAVQRNVNGISISVDPRIELLAAVQMISSYDKRYHLMTRLNLSYKTDIKEYFSKYS